MNKKKHSKRMGIKIITNLNNDIYFFDNNNHLDEENMNYLLLEDNQTDFIEKENNLDGIAYLNEETNKNISLEKNNFSSIYENKYTIKKPNIINQALLDKYKGQEEVDTNLVIQMIHNNEDIKKIVSLYINDVVFSLSNIVPSFNRDAITKITDNYYYDDINHKIMVKNSEYRYDDLKILLNTLQKYKFLYGFSNTKDNILFAHLKSISLFRNYIFHDDLKISFSKEVENELNKYIYEKGKDFLNNNKFNVGLISQLYSSNKQEELIKYYKYVLNGLDKNIGLSIKKIVEYSLELYPPNLDEEQLKKYHVVLKYHIFNILNNNKELTNKYIVKLRNSDFSEKESIYLELVKEIGKSEYKKVEQICSLINFKEKVYIDVSDIVLNNYQNKWTGFVLNIYSLTKFLTIKETNELVSSLITKLQSLYDLLMASLKLDINITKELNTDLLIVNFDELLDTIDQLRVINSIKKFTNPKHSKSSIDYLKQGLSIFKHDTMDLDSLLKETMNNEEIVSKRIKYPIKNFVRNNVINTKFFNYILRYADPNKVSGILYNNPKLVEFLLSNLSESQLKKYANVKDLPNIISNITLESINTNLKNGNLDYSKYINLYLTCLYLLIKNINKINCYYFIALSFYVRDYQLVNGLDPFDNNRNSKYTYMDLTNIIKNNDTDKKAIDKSIINFDKIDDNLFRNYRNKIAHCNIITDLIKTNFPQEFEYKNYFKIYQYCLQTSLLKECNDEYAQKINNDIQKYNKYSKNFLFAINSPLMYNYSRYKNISDENIFMRIYNQD